MVTGHKWSVMVSRITRVERLCLKHNSFIIWLYLSVLVMRGVIQHSAPIWQPGFPRLSHGVRYIQRLCVQDAINRHNKEQSSQSLPCKSQHEREKSQHERKTEECNTKFGCTDTKRTESNPSTYRLACKSIQHLICMSKIKRSLLRVVYTHPE